MSSSSCEMATDLFLHRASTMMHPRRLLALYQSVCDPGKHGLFVLGARGFAVLHRSASGESGSKPVCGLLTPSGDAMRALLMGGLLALLCAVLLIAQDSSKRNAEEGHLLALESAWNHAEQSKDAAALNQLLGFTKQNYRKPPVKRTEFRVATP